MAKKKEEKEDVVDENSEGPEGQKYAEILKVYAENPGITYKEIAKKVGTTEKYVGNVMSKYLSKIKSKPPEELQPLDEMEYLRRIIASTWTTSKAELIISLFQDHDPNDLRILHNLLNKAQCPKTSAELIIYSWAKHRHVAADRVKEMFKHNKSLLHTFRELGYFEDLEDEDDTDEDGKPKKEEEEEDVSDILEDLKKEKLKELKKKLEELRLKKEMKEIEKQLNEYDDYNKGDSFEFDDKDMAFDMQPMAPPTVMRKVVRPAINPVTGEILRDDNGNIVFETVEEPVDGRGNGGGMDDTMRWMLAMQQTKKEDPEKELLKKEIEELKRKMEEEEKRKKEEEERRRYEEQIKQMQEQMQKFQEQVMQTIQAIQQQNNNSTQESFEQKLLLKLMEDRDKVPPEVMQVIQEEREIIKKLQEQPKTDSEKEMLVKQIEELKNTLEKKERDEMFNKYNQYINALYAKIENMEKTISNKSALSDEKYKIDKVIEMDKSRANLVENSLKEAREGFLEPLIKVSMEQIRQQDMWNKYMMLLQEEQRRGLPPGTLIDKFFGTPKVSEDEKKKILERIDKELGTGT